MWTLMALSTSTKIPFMKALKWNLLKLVKNYYLVRINTCKQKLKGLHVFPAKPSLISLFRMHQEIQRSKRVILLINYTIKLRRKI